MEWSFRPRSTDYLQREDGQVKVYQSSSTTTSPWKKTEEGYEFHQVVGFEVIVLQAEARYFKIGAVFRQMK